MAGGARVFERMARHAGPLIEHGQAAVRSIFEQRQRDVSAWQFIVAAAAVIGCVASGASRAVERGVAAVNIVLPARRVRHRPHHLMAGRAAVPRRRIGSHTKVAGETFGRGRGGLIAMLEAKALVVRRRLHVVVVTRR